MVKGNKYTDVLTARKKLTRNKLLAIPLRSYKNKYGLDVVVYAYGKLEITVSGSTIVYIQQLGRAPRGFVHNKTKYKYYNELLGL